MAEATAAPRGSGAGRALGARAADGGHGVAVGGAPAPAGDWSAVLEALGALEARQAGARAEMGALQRRLEGRADAVAGTRAAHEREVAGLRAAQAAAAVQFERRGRALAASAAQARRLCSRARGSSLRACAAVGQARTDAEAARARLQAADSALDAKCVGQEKLRRRVLELERQLEAQNLLSRQQSVVLDEAASVLREAFYPRTAAAN
mmetsp:Transcript_87128/g.249671  ORF Transcript_87128/g.249671 Transcript_87128/m.249671 type:complete len:208 (+) Transcript_87128:2-625(+)